ASEEMALSQILATPEFFNRAQTMGFGDTPNGNYVRGLYQALLGRTASAAEVAGWVNALQGNTVTRQGVALGILSTSEYRTDVAAGYYTGLLHRSASQAEISFWVNSGLDEVHDRIGIEASTEFFTNG